MPSAARRFALALVLLPAALAPAPALADKPRLHLQRVDTVDCPLVKASLTLVESDGRVVTGKGPPDFKLVFDSNEQGVAVDVKTADQLGEPVYLVLVAQVSTAMHDVLDDAKRGLKQLAQAATELKAPAAAGGKGATSQVALIAYAQDVKRVAEMGKPEAIDGAAAGVAEDPDGTEVHLLDAIRTAIDLLNAKGVPDKGRKLIVVFSDGIDVSGSDKKAFTELGKRANLAGIVVDTIGYAPFDPSKLRNFYELSRQTNGTDRTCKSPQDVSAQFSNTADEIRKQYITLFQSVTPGDSRDHGIQVLTDAGGAPVYSETVNAPWVPGKPVEKPKEPTPWWVWALVAGVPILGVIVFLVLRARRNRPEPEAEPEPVAAAPPPVAAAGGNRTMAIDLGSSDRGPTIGWIVGMNGRYTDKTFRLKPARTVIGTSTEADIVIEDPKASRKHCEIRYDGSSFKIIDLGSTNGVVLNDKRTPTADLVDGDLFRLGGTDFKFKSIN